MDLQDRAELARRDLWERAMTKLLIGLADQLPALAGKPGLTSDEQRVLRLVAYQQPPLIDRIEEMLRTPPVRGFGPCADQYLFSEARWKALCALLEECAAALQK